MRIARRSLALLSLTFILSVGCLAQAPQPQPPAKDPSASVSGRVTIGGKAAPGITITASMSASFFDTRTLGKTVTDEEGNYRLTRLPAGSFQIVPIAKALAVGPEGKSKQLGQTVNVAEGESVTKVDFVLVRGGVVTGRVTDAEGNPIIGERVSVVAKDAGEEGPRNPFTEGPRNKTDDRGIYRVYGLSPGHYKVSVGQAAGAGGASVMGMGGSQYLKTFYPGVQDESKATILEVNEGAELANIDITPGKPASGFSVSGRAVDADSGQPIPNAYIVYSRVKDGELQMEGMSFTGAQTDANGKFRLESVKPGRYAVFTMAAGQENSNYSDPAPFEMSDSDVSGIEIKVHRGATINGVAVIENNFDPAVAAILKAVVLYAYVPTKGMGAPSYAAGKINPDGTFQFTGLAPGKAKIGVQGFPTPPKGLSLVRTEVDGMDQPEGIELAAGAQVKGVRLVFAYGTGIVRGEVKLEGGTLPPGTNLALRLRSPAGDNRRFNRYVEIDSRSHFVAENLPAGTYELFLQVVGKDGTPAADLQPVVRTITVANGSEVQATLVVNLVGKKAGEN
jgi:protocatechuate 3,4-dioxygenase beta subunit